MKRRDFLKSTVLAGAALSLDFTGLQAALNTESVAVAKAPGLVAVMGGEPAAMLDKALAALGGLGRYVKKGQKVAIKPNIGWDKTPALAANTNPELIEALVRKCFAAGASEVTVFDHTCDNWQKCYATSGIAEAVKKAGGKMVPANDEKYYKEVSIPNGVKQQKAKIHEALIDADVWINVPVLKDHGGAKLSCCMKNYMGIVWDRRTFHMNNLQQSIADICTWNKRPVLNIVDAYRVIHQNGPQGRSLADVAELKSLIISSNIIAAESAALKLYNQVQKLDLSAVGHITKGEELKLGSTDLSKISIKRIKM